MDLPWQMQILLVGFPVAFIILWCCVCYLLSITSGWRRLAETYSSPQKAKILGGLRSATVGQSNYQRCLRIESTKEGLKLQVLLLFRLGHPDLLIPWRDIHFANPEDYQLENDQVLVEVGSPVRATITLKRTLVKELAMRNRTQGTDVNS